MTDYAHQCVLKYITKDSYVIDATAGNGHDTVFLASHAFHVTAFDIQDAAIVNTKQQLDALALSNVTLIQDSHAKMLDYVNHSVDAVLFNLGYLPSSDKQITTMSESTLAALKASLSLLNEGGGVIMTLYLGHHEGKIEAKTIETFIQTLSSQRYTVLKHTMMNRSLAPYIIEIHKR